MTVKRRKQIALAMMSILLLGASGLRAESESGPFERFFRSMRRAFTEPHQPARSHRSKQHAKTESPSPSPGETSGGGKPPDERNTRTTVRANSKKGEDLRYGIPVPGKQGFVTSPFSPDSGYIDVRGFQPGTPVKDPYSGKIILTP
jgi:hypothetical protein